MVQAPLTKLANRSRVAGPCAVDEEEGEEVLDSDIDDHDEEEVSFEAVSKVSFEAIGRSALCLFLNASWYACSLPPAYQCVSGGGGSR